MRIGIVGGGFMGEAFLRGLLRAGVAQPGDIAVAEISESRRTALSEHGVRVTNDAQSACIGADVVLLAVKPQHLEDVAATIRGAIQPDAVVVSIAAAVPLAEVQSLTGHRACVRVMPNLPSAVVGEGAAAYLEAPEVSRSQHEKVRAVLSAVSSFALEVPDDDAIDLATAIHGSGPGYIYLVIESMIDAGVRLGMGRDDAQRLVVATVIGAARYMQESGAHPAELRSQITSPGGTTAAGLMELEAAGIRAAFHEAIEAAYARAQELADG